MSTSYVTDKPIDMEALRNFHHNGITVDSIEEDDIILTAIEDYFQVKLISENEDEFDNIV